MSISNVIIVNKKTFYEFCFLNKAGISAGERKRFSQKDIALFKEMHMAHQNTLMEVKRVLAKYGSHYHISNRKAHIPYQLYDFVITVGGDGTFLQAASRLTQQRILGVKSDAKRSVGKFCAANEKNFEKIFLKILSGKIVTRALPRFSLEVTESKKRSLVLNDILVCDANPAAMSRYELMVEGKREEQRSSGLWIATASGSTGAIRSSGGIMLKDTNKKIQYRPRELYFRERNQYQLTGNALNLKNPLKIRSLMRKGVIYIDGAHTKVPFEYGKIATIKHSLLPIHTFI
jgi:NAD+ kinase